MKEIFLTEKEFYSLPKHKQTGCANYDNGNKAWYKKGSLHRNDGPAVEYPNGDKVWYKNGQIHRDDGPAVEYPNGTKYWYKNGDLHRDDGPAVEYPNGSKDYYLNNIKYSYQQWFAISNNLEKFI